MKALFKRHRNTLTKDRIETVIAMLNDKEEKKVIKDWWELIPSGCLYNQKDKVRMVLGALDPDIIANNPDVELYNILQAGPPLVRSKNDQFSNQNILKEMKKWQKNGELEKIAKHIWRCVDCPEDLKSTEYILLVAIQRIKDSGSNNDEWHEWWGSLIELLPEEERV